MPVNSLIAEALGDGCTEHCAVSIGVGNDIHYRGTLSTNLSHC